MKARHLKDRELLDIIMQSSGTEIPEQFRLHIAACDRCEKRLRLIRAIFHADPTESAPGEAVRDRIFESYHRIRAQRDARSRWRRFFSVPALRYATACLVAVLVASGIYLGITIDRQSSSASFALRASVVQGSTTIDGVKPAPNTRIRESAMISAAADSLLQLSGEDSIDIFIGGGSTVTLDQARHLRTEKKNSIALVLSQGAVRSRLGPHRVPLAFRIDTPHSRIISLGTDFIVTVTAGETRILLGEGRLRIQHLKSGAETVAEKGSIHTIAGTIHASPLSAADYERACRKLEHGHAQNRKGKYRHPADHKAGITPTGKTDTAALSQKKKDDAVTKASDLKESDRRRHDELRENRRDMMNNRNEMRDNRRRERPGR